MILVEVAVEPVTNCPIVFTRLRIYVPHDVVVNPVAPLVLLAHVVPPVVEFVI
jgi:hypothetical protein